jgi:hypothetical protein
VRPRNTLFLLLVLAALGAYLYWVELPQQKRQAEEKLLLAFDKERVTAIGLDYPDHAIALEKSAEGHWRIVRPLEADADDTTVRNLITAIADAQVTKTLEDVSDKLASYGLATPEATVTLTVKDTGTLPALKIGKTTQVGFSTYAQKGDDPKVYITGGALQTGTKKQVKDLRDKTVIAFEDTEVQKLELRHDQGAIVVEHEGGDRWTITAPARYPADSGEMRALLASLRGLRADDFVSEEAGADLAPYGLASPQLALSVWLGKDQAQKTLLVGGTHEEAQKKTLYAKRAERPTVYTIPDYALKNLDKGLGTLRDKTVLAFEKEKATGLAVTRKDGAGFTLVKREGTWHLDTPGEGAERVPTIARFVDDVAGFKGSEIVAEKTADLAQYGLAEPDLSIAVSDEKGPLGTVLAARTAPGAGSDAEAESYVAAAGTGIVYGVKPYAFDRLDKKAADFREPPATPAPSGAGVATPGEEAGGALNAEDAGGEDLGGEDEGFGDDEDAE